MKTNDSGSMRIVRVEPADEQETVFHCLEESREKFEGVVIVLPNKSTKAFQSPKDFYDLKVLRRQWDLQIVFVIPKQGQAQLARANNFTVYASWETLVKTISGREPQSPPMPPRYAADLPMNSARLQQRLSSLTQASLQDKPSSDFFTPAQRSKNGEMPRHIADPITPLPPVSEEFLEQAMARLSSSQPLQPKIPTPTPAPTTLPSIAQKGQRRQLWFFVVLLITVLLSAALSARLLLFQKDTSAGVNSSTNAPATMIVGHFYFLSSGQVNEMGTAGINDVMELALSHLAAPAPGKSYYAWLRSDTNRSDGPFMFLGQLQISQGKAQLTYRDPQHTNWLMTMSQFLITEEDSATQPTIPSPDHATWRYVGLIPQTPNPADTQDHFSYLDHLRHVLAGDPTLEKLGLHGGLSFWLDKNTRKVGEWATAAQDEPNPDLIHRHILRILDYLDGIHDVARDVPGGSPILVDQIQGQAGLLQIRADQAPASYLQHIGFHLTSMINSPGAGTDEQRLAQQLVVAMDNVNVWLKEARQDAQKLVAMSNDQLLQPSAHALINDLATQTNNAYIGVTDPATGNVQHGVTWIHTTMQNMAVIDIKPYCNKC